MQAASYNSGPKVAAWPAGSTELGATVESGLCQGFSTKALYSSDAALGCDVSLQVRLHSSLAINLVDTVRCGQM